MGINKIPTSDDVICSEERLPPDIMRQKVTKLNISSPYTKTESYITLAMLWYEHIVYGRTLSDKVMVRQIF